MSVDILQEKIRKTKNPSMLELNLCPDELPPQFSRDAMGYGSFCRELLAGLKGVVPAVRVSFSSFALLGAAGLDQLTEVLKCAKELGYYVAMDAPELLSPKAASLTAQAVFGDNSQFVCDGLVISGYAGSDVIKPFLPYCKDGKKDIFVVARTANKSAPEIQDLLAGGRIVHAAAADHVNRYGADTAGKFGYTRVGILAAASSAESLRSLRAVCAMLKAQGVKNVNLDFSVVNDMNYYSGIVFRGFIDGIPEGILSGGRYDKLIRKMGKTAGALGFAVYLDMLELLDKSDKEYGAYLVIEPDEACGQRHIKCHVGLRATIVRDARLYGLVTHRAKHKIECPSIG